MNPRRIVGEGPTVVGMMTSSLESGGSLDAAVRSVAEEGPPLSGRLFSEVVRTVDTKGHTDIRGCLMDRLSSLPDDVAGYRRAMHLCIAASESGDRGDRLRMLRDASDTALESVREMGEAYGSSLNVPFMTVFGIGIMVPMILMSVLPMVSMGGMFGGSAIDGGTIMAVTLVLVPSVVLAVTLSMRMSNPFLTRRVLARDVRFALPLLVSIPLSSVYLSMGIGTDGILLYSLAPAAILAMLLMLEDRRRESSRMGCERGLRDCVFDMGNRMLTGTNFETASAEAMRAVRECEVLGERYERELDLCRGDVGGAIGRAVGDVSDEMAHALRGIHMCSVRDLDDAGGLAIALGRQYQGQNSTRRALEIRMKGLTDTMLATATVFAPVVLGLSIAMLEPISKLSGDAGLDGTSAVLSVYLVELCAIISLLTSSIGSGEGFARGLWRFCIMCPVSLLVFQVCCSIQL